MSGQSAEIKGEENKSTYPGESCTHIATQTAHYRFSMSSLGGTSISSKFFLQLTLNPSIFDIVISCMHLGERARFKHLSRQARDAVNTFNRRAHNVNKHLKLFFGDNYLSFRSLQARTGTLISGSVPLQILDQSIYPGSDLDIYVDLKHALEVAQWIDGMGYTFVPSMDQLPFYEDIVSARLMSLGRPPHGSKLSPSMLERKSAARTYGFKSLGFVLSFTKTMADGAKRKVQVIAARESPMEVILNFHSSLWRHIIRRLLLMILSSMRYEHRLVREHLLAMSIPHLH